MQVKSTNPDLLNYLMVVVVYGTAAQTINRFVETAADMPEKEFIKIKTDFWSRSGQDLHDTIFGYMRDENTTESLSWSETDIQKFWQCYPPNTGQRLLSALEELKENSGELSEYFGKRVSMLSLSAAQRIAPQLPDTLPAGKIGIDEDGDLFFSFDKGDKSVFLTIEPNELHLLIKGGGEKSRYFDEVPYDDFKIPTNILEELSEI